MTPYGSLETVSTPHPTCGTVTLEGAHARVLADLEARLADRKEEVKALEAQIKKIKSIDEDTLSAIVKSLQGIG